MPHYEFFCHACKKTFSKVLTLAEYEEGEFLCPHCGSNNVEQELVRVLCHHFQEERLRTKARSTAPKAVI
jgi:putative FmdB family regulatory protein